MADMAEPDTPAPAPTSVRRRHVVLIALAGATVAFDIAELAVALRVGHMTGLALWALALTIATVVTAYAPVEGGVR
ncbi:hypothetical protein [Actinomyces gaoshouyii]|uniref:hypothetical protein n=1 Tax=Actinomyces gaoshouyii TaxID=1960083 RepID=UPI0009C199BB|nr:hypothetical protein [Actinomyces gaoshouyii]ARD42483.1 hypothetical protein B6G06_09145 [Actinomyces gaoshouyii]